MTRHTLLGALAFAVFGGALIVATTYLYIPRFAITAPSFNAQVGKGGERTISFYKGRLYYQEHAFLGIGIPRYKVHWYPSRDTWDWYHQAERKRKGAWSVYFGGDREHGDMAYWYNTEFEIRRFSLWIVGFPLFFLGLVAVVGTPLLLHSYRRIVRLGRLRKGRCGYCAYNLTGNVSGICPECGTERVNG